jgi:serine/threonine protein phosphatase PrpC
MGLHPGDIMIVATGGIHRLTGEAVTDICAETATLDASDVAVRFIGAICDAGHLKQDNITIVVVK